MSILVLAIQGVTGLFILLSVNFVLQYQPIGRFLYPALLPIVGFLAIGLLMPASNHKVKWALFIAAQS